MDVELDALDACAERSDGRSAAVRDPHRFATIAAEILGLKRPTRRPSAPICNIDAWAERRLALRLTG